MLCVCMLKKFIKPQIVLSLFTYAYKIRYMLIYR